VRLLCPHWWFFYLGKHLFTANIGDSRAILITRKSDKEVIELSFDHKPDNKLEKDRILKKGGRVEPYYDEHGNPLGPYRVWQRFDNIPGLAMSRSFGD